MNPVSVTDRYQFPLQPTRLPGDPIFRNDWPIKRWKDPSAAGKESVSYQFWNGSDTAPELVELALPGDEAAAVNMPGVPTFEAYVVAPTKAQIQLHIGLFSALQPIPDPSVLSTRAQADALAVACKGTVIDPYANNVSFAFVPNGEDRYPWKIKFGYGDGNTGPDDPSRSSYAGQIVRDINAKGVGAPFHFSASQLAQGLLEVVHDSIPDGSNDPLGELLPPVQIGSDEALASVMVGPGIFTVQVVSKSAQGTPTQLPAPVPVSGGGLTDEEHGWLSDIHKAVVAPQ